MNREFERPLESSRFLAAWKERHPRARMPFAGVGQAGDVCRGDVFDLSALSIGSPKPERRTDALGA